MSAFFMAMNSGLMTVCGYIVCGFIGAIAATILWYIWTDRIDLCGVLNEVNGTASMSRLQLLIFTFVIAVSFFELVEKGAMSGGGLPDIPSGVLTLLGISASTYAVGKGISYSRTEGVTTRRERSEALDTRTKGRTEAAAANTNPVVLADQAIVMNEPKQD
ncbi:hypothetical protein BH10ACI4_BH10ACI4_13390 [soil metagenome]